ncbi:carbonic anhydrase 14 isoform X2 [Haliaeetus albicilla]|uniref:carbonic anhydrase 14 isoform X2 n=1 Tax=Haliaeetus albicilla TaxID=8969 RepID=UPI0037E8FBBC
MDPPSLPVPPGGAIPGGYLRPDRRHPAPPRHAACPAAAGGPGPRPARRPPRAAALARGAPGMRGPSPVTHRHPNAVGAARPLAATHPPRGPTRHPGLHPLQQRPHRGAGTAALPAATGAATQLRRRSAPLPLGTARPRWRCRTPPRWAPCPCREPLCPQMHVVHYDAERYTNASEAQHHAGGLAVLGILLEVGADPHPTYNNILSHLGSIRYAGQTTAIPSFSVQDLLPPRLDLYYRYNGSLTTPPCFQSVLWTLFQQPVRISLAQLEQLQGTLYTTTAAEPEPQRLVDNFRVPQELNQRLVLSSFPRGEVIAIIFGAVSSCLGLFLAIHFVAKRMRARRAQDQDVVFKASSHRTHSDDGPRP